MTPQNPPIPAGYELLSQSSVTPEMTKWAVDILKTPALFPMFATEIRYFSNLQYLARVEWHPPDFQNNTVHRGVTLYRASLTSPPSPSPNPMTNRAKGIDISSYQPTINWPVLAAGGVSFAFIKATEGTTILDRTFVDHWAKAKAASVLRGAYHFFRPKLDAAEQARFFLVQLSDPGELPPVIDVEVADGVPPSQIADGVGIWVDMVSKALGRPIVYTSPGFWGTIPPIALNADLWVANWGVTAPGACHGFPDWKFWQFTNTATLSGITGQEDADFFNGSLADLCSYSAAFIASRSGTIPSPPPKDFDLGTTLGIQQALNFLGAVTPPLKEDGARGPKTDAAIEAYAIESLKAALARA